MAPMIDMVFLLLVFFMTVSTLAKDARPELDLPFSVVGKVPEAAPLREVVTVMNEGGGFIYYSGNRPMDLPALVEHLEKQSAAGTLDGVLLRGPVDLPWSAWRPVWERCQTLGLEAVVFATFEG